MSDLETLRQQLRADAQRYLHDDEPCDDPELRDEFLQLWNKRLDLVTSVEQLEALEQHLDAMKRRAESVRKEMKELEELSRDGQSMAVH